MSLVECNEEYKLNFQLLRKRANQNSTGTSIQISINIKRPVENISNSSKLAACQRL